MFSAMTQDSVDQVFALTSEMQSFTVFVRHQNRWLRGCQFDSFDAATTQARDSFRRSGLSVEVRDDSGTVHFRQRAGIPATVHLSYAQA